MASESSKRILVVDDEAAVAEVLQYLLEDEGYAVVTATAAEDALVKLSEGGFAAALFDVSMGEVSGLHIAKELKTNPLTVQIPVIILTGTSERSVREEFTGYDLFVSKGDDLTELVSKLAALLGADDVQVAQSLQ